jgi:hypothetical protein
MFDITYCISLWAATIAIHSRSTTQARLHLGIACCYGPGFSHPLPAICMSRKRTERNSQVHGKASALRRA